MKKCQIYGKTYLTVFKSEIENSLFSVKIKGYSLANLVKISDLGKISCK